MPLSLVTFRSDATPPIGAPTIGSSCIRATTITNPLEVHGLVLFGSGDPIVIACVDWTSIGGESFALWRDALAKAAGTTPSRVLLSTLHQHGAPMEDWGAHRIMSAQPHPTEVGVIDAAFHEKARLNAAAAVAKAVNGPRSKLTHIGTGEAEVERFASNRRILGEDGKVKAMRHSSSKRYPHLRDEPLGLIDPMLKILSFWDGESLIATLSCYGTHPMSFYGGGEVTYDVPGLARERLMKEQPGVHHIYATGCGGDQAAGKFNDGSMESRVAMTDRLSDAMRRALARTARREIQRVDFRVTPLPLEPRREEGFGAEEMKQLLADTSAPCYERLRAAFFLAYLDWYAAGHRIDLPVIDFGSAVLTLLPGEPFIAFQLAAQKMRPDAMVMVMGYGDYSPVYICTDEAFEQGGYEPGEWGFVGPGSQKIVMDALRAGLQDK